MNLVFGNIKHQLQTTADMCKSCKNLMCYEMLMKYCTNRNNVSLDTKQTSKIDGNANGF